MKRFLLFTFCLLLFSSKLFAQSPPQAFNYQAVARDNAGNPMNSQTINIRSSVLQGSASGSLMWEETFSPTTNQFGLFTLQLGQGVHTGGSLPTFASIDWAANSYWLKIEMNTGSGYMLMGTQQFVSVPYSMVADTVVHEKNLTLNDLTDVNTAGAVNGNTLQYNGTTWVPVSGGSGSLGQSAYSVYGSSTMACLNGVTTFAVIPGLTQTINVPAGYSVLISTYGGFQTTATGIGYSTVDFGLFIDGSLPTNGGFQRNTALTNNAVGTTLSIWSMSQSLSLSAGNHTFETRAKWSSGSSANVSGDNTTAVQGVLTVTLIKN